MQNRYFYCNPRLRICGAATAWLTADGMIWGCLDDYGQVVPTRQNLVFQDDFGERWNQF